MALCYAPDASFADPEFAGLRGERPCGMWRMLTGRATDLQVELVSRDADESAGTARWVAGYRFAQTGRRA